MTDLLCAGVAMTRYRERAHRLSRQLCLMLLAAILLGMVVFPIFFSTAHSATTPAEGEDTDPHPADMPEIRTINTLDDELDLLREGGDHYRTSYTIQPDVAAKLDLAVEYIYCNYHEDISRENLAAHVGLSPSYFGRLFKIHTGRKFGDYINDLRVRRAAELLRSTDRVIIEIAFEPGFESLRTFNRVFMNTTGKTPSEYRDSASGQSA
jgi:AraC-like DNA-binding protein